MKVSGARWGKRRWGQLVGRKPCTNSEGVYGGRLTHLKERGLEVRLIVDSPQQKIVMRKEPCRRRLSTKFDVEVAEDPQELESTSAMNKTAHRSKIGRAVWGLRDRAGHFSPTTAKWLTLPEDRQSFGIAIGLIGKDKMRNESSAQFSGAYRRLLQEPPGSGVNLPCCRQMLSERARDSDTSVATMLGINQEIAYGGREEHKRLDFRCLTVVWRKGKVVEGVNGGMRRGTARDDMHVETGTRWSRQMTSHGSCSTETAARAQERRKWRAILKSSRNTISSRKGATRTVGGVDTV
ncbi:hypothetical protein B0H16DRAFT_1469311 [Mycena metata]|uniref:Uncharacterized protein n=1 Tax=Mycena metata TaxID=1033252 RepID=A0AAD7HY60_9AGAR|nr:hypothetical protein B0H16DRAFT_1469311 [Mycena metata]